MSRRMRLRQTVVAVVVVVVGAGVLGIPAASLATTAPAAPAGLTVTFGAGSAVLGWTDSSSDETGFSIERCVGPDCTSFGQIATVGADTTSYPDSFYATGINRYRIRALNSSGPSEYSNTAETVIVGTGDVFASVSASPTAGQAPLTVTFDGSASGSLNGTVSGWAWSFGDNATASGAVVSHTYDAPGVYAASLKVTSTGAFTSTNSTAVIVAVTVPPLAAPSDLSATSPARERVRLTWTDPVGSATSLALERCRGAGCGAFARIAVLTPSTTTFTDVTVKKGTTYTYRLAASDTTGTVYSNSAVVTVRR